MLGGFVKGAIGSALTFGAVFVFIGLVAAGATVGTAFVIAAVMGLSGAYLSYVSRQTTRIRR